MEATPVLFDFPISLPEGISVEEARSMANFIRVNFPSETEVKFPAEWEHEDKRAFFCSLSDAVLGEDESSKWLIQKVFSKYGIDECDFDSEPGKEVVKSKFLIGNESNLVDSFLRHNSKYLKSVIETVSKKYFFQEQTSSSLVVDGIYQSLSCPGGAKLDQRFRFFLRFPEYLTQDAVELLASSNVDIGGGVTDPVSLALWLASGGLGGKVSLEDIKGKSNLRVKKSIVNILKKNRDVESGLLQKLLSLIESSDNSVWIHVTHLINSKCKNHIGSETSRAKRVAAGKECGTHEYHKTIGSEDGETDFSSLMVGYCQIPSEDGTTLSVSGGILKRHSEFRSPTWTERTSKTNISQKTIIGHMSSVRSLAMNIVKGMRESASETMDELISGKKEVSDSVRLEVILPEFLLLYVDAALGTISECVRTDSEIIDHKMLSKYGLMVSYKSGRSEISVAKDGRVKVAVSAEDLNIHIQKVVYHMRNIAKYFPKDGDISKVDVDIVVSHINNPMVTPELVTATMRGMLIWKLRESRRSHFSSGELSNEEEFSDFIDYCSRSRSMQAASLKSDFAHRWTKMMPYLFRPQNPELPVGKYNKRVYQNYEAAVVRDLFGLISVHACISEGTIVKTVENEYVTEQNITKEERKRCIGFEAAGRYRYAKDTSGERMLRRKFPYAIGKAWGWNINRETKVSNTEMYYALLGSPIDDTGSVPVITLPEKIMETKKRYDALKAENQKGGHSII